MFNSIGVRATGAGAVSKFLYPDLDLYKNDAAL
jgi:hypothetical protein